MVWSSYRSALEHDDPGRFVGAPRLGRRARAPGDAPDNDDFPAHGCPLSKSVSTGTSSILERNHPVGLLDVSCHATPKAGDSRFVAREIDVAKSLLERCPLRVKL